METWQIVSLIMGVLAAFFGFYWVRAKNVITEVKVLFQIISDAIADDTLTKEELKAITDQIQKILATFKASVIKQAADDLKRLFKK